MATKTSAGRDFQDNLLGRILDQNQIATIYLLNRMSLRGRILRFDPYVILLEPLDGGPPHMVYKSAVVSVSGPRRIGGPGGRGPGGPGRGGPRPPRDFHRDGPPPRFEDRRPPHREGYEPPPGGFRPPRPTE